MKALTARLMDHARSLAGFVGYGIDWSCTFPLKVKRFRREAVKRILVVDLLHIGDLVATTPVVGALHKHFPEARISFMLLKGMEALMEGNPSVQEIIGVDACDIRERPEVIAERLAAGRFDLVVLLHPSPDIGSWRVSQLLRQAGIPFRIGGTRVGLLEGGGFFLHRRAKPRWRLQHKIDDLLDVVATIGVTQADKRPELFVHPMGERWANAFIKEHRAGRGPIVCFHPCPQHESHRWIEERWAALANQLIERTQATVFFTGAEKDKEYNREIIAMIHHPSHAINAAGTTLRQLVGLVNQCQLVVSVDTGTMHIAAGLGIPVIALFGAGNPTIWRPYSRKASVIFKEDVAHVGCMVHHCYLTGERKMECMKEIATQEVFHAALSILQQKP